MGLETGTFISDLVATNPLGSDQKTTADDHIRLTKFTLKSSFPNVNGAVNPTPTEFNYLVGVTSGIQGQFATKGAITGQTWTGSHNFPTQTQGNNSTLAATTSYVDTGLATKGAITGQTWTGSHNFTGATPTFTTQAQNNNSTAPATTAYVDAFSPIGAWVRLSTATASASSAIDFTSLITSTYDVYLVEIINAKPATNGTFLSIYTSANNGVSYDSGASNYYQILSTTATSSWTVSGGAGSYVILSGAMSNAREGYSGFVYLFSPSASARCNIKADGSFISSVGSVSQICSTSFYRDSAAAVNAIRFAMLSGNITSGTFNLYGRKKT